MSKYRFLWENIQKREEPTFVLTFDEIAEIAGVPMDHSFLTYKKELLSYGYTVGKISLKAQTVTFHQIEEER